MSDSPRMGLSLGLADLTASGLVRIPLAKLGTWFKGARKFSITKQDLADAVRNFRKRKADLVVDYEHASENPAEAQGQAIPAAAWVKSVDDGPDDAGLLWGQVELTDDTRALIGAKKLKYVSPFLDWTQRDRDSGEPQGLTFTSIAFTNRPFLDMMPAIALSEAGWTDFDPGDGADAREEVSVNKITQVALTDDRRVRVTFEGGETVVSTETVPAPKTIGLSDVKRDAKSGQLDFASLDLSGDALVAGEVFRAQQAQVALNDAEKAGKILPAQRAFYERMALNDLTGFHALVASMKPQVDMATRGTGDAGEGAPNDAQSKVHLQIHPLVQQKIAASDGKKDYGTAWQEVLRDRPDLAKAYMATM